MNIDDLTNGLVLAYEGDNLLYGVLPCTWCGNPIVECGFEDCAFYNWIHIDGTRKGSHKCGRTWDGVVRDKSAMPAGYIEDGE